MGCSGQSELGGLLGGGLFGEDNLERLLGQLATGDQPFIVLLDQQRAGQPQQLVAWLVLRLGRFPVGMFRKSQQQGRSSTEADIGLHASPRQTRLRWSWGPHDPTTPTDPPIRSVSPQPACGCVNYQFRERGESLIDGKIAS